MTLIVAAFGAMITVMCLVGLAQPERFRAFFDIMTGRKRFVLAVGIRLLMGVLLWWLADELRHPHVMRILAVIALAAAVAILGMGQKRLDRMVSWWLGLGDGLLRVSLTFASAFGAYLVYVAI